MSKVFYIISIMSLVYHSEDLKYFYHFSWLPLSSLFLNIERQVFGDLCGTDQSNDDIFLSLTYLDCIASQYSSFFWKIWGCSSQSKGQIKIWKEYFYSSVKKKMAYLLVRP